VTPPSHPLDPFHPAVRAWFRSTLGEPSPPQTLGWPSIAGGRNTLILAPTGSGKTLAAFLWTFNHLVERRLRGDAPAGVSVLYVSPLKALNNDIHRNLEEPLRGIRAEAEAMGTPFPPITSAVRTGDTSATARTQMLRRPPDILITTPESLYLMLTSPRARGILRTVQFVIVDEIHAVCGNKRGVHLSISLERLAALCDAEFVRIGLSATQRPLDRVAAFLGGYDLSGPVPLPRPVQVVDAGGRRAMDLTVECVAPDFALLPPDGIWSMLHERLSEEISRHRTTLVFVNNRRTAEKVAARMNLALAAGEGNAGTGSTAPEPLPATAAGMGAHHVPEEAPPAAAPIQAYHGSMSREAREKMETDLKAGRTSALVATSALELGIDIGSVDLVVQIQSPKGVARGLQRVGRSGHVVSARSKGRILPTHREDLVESAVVARGMAEHDVEEVMIPANCLDVLAQQIVAAVGVEEWDVEELFLLVRGSACYRDLSRDAYLSVLAMVSGRYAGEAFRELQGRISWDRVNGRLSALPGTARLAITGGGTIADRGTFGVYLEDGKTRVGEVDEEFMFESRPGDTFILGTSVWRIGDIGRDRVTVSPAPGQPARMPFWRGEGIGRGYELGARVGEFRRTMAARLDNPDCLAWLEREYPVDANAAWNILQYFRRQRDVTGIVPHDRLLVLEHFRDEIGDPRLVLHSPFGRRVNGLLGMLLAERVRERTGTEPQMLYNDDGILLRPPGADALPGDLLEGLDPAPAADSVLEAVMTSPLFAGQFRANASRALLLPRSDPRKRIPLWLQRLRAADLLDVVRRHGDFPIVIETAREVLNDVLDFPRFREVLEGIAGGTIGLHTVHTEVPSPFAAGLLFEFIAVFMYEADQNRAERQSGMLTINRELLAQVADLETSDGLIRPEAVEAVEARLQHRAGGTAARSPEELLAILLRVGDLTEPEIVERSAGGGLQLLASLEGNGRAVMIEIRGERRWIAGEEGVLYSRRGEPQSLAALVDRYLASHGPVTAGEIAARFDVPEPLVESLLSAREGKHLVRGRFRPDAPPARQEWCSRQNLSRIHRETLGILRREISPVPLEDYTRFLLEWQHRDPGHTLAGALGMRDILRQLQGTPLPLAVWERDILGGRFRGDASAALEGVMRDGTMVWLGAGQGRVRPVFRGEGALFLGQPAGHDEPLSPAAVRTLDYLRSNGASFFGDIRSGTGLSLDAVNRSLSALFRAGLVTGDVLAELRNLRRSTRGDGTGPDEPVRLLTPSRNPATSRMMQRARRAIREVAGWTGRWSPVRTPAILGEPLAPPERARLVALQALDRYGILARELFRREDLISWAEVAGALQRMELLGEVRRGYFVEGLSGMQYALPEAVDRLRSMRSMPGAGPIMTVNQLDPAIPYGADVPFRPGSAVQPARLAGSYLVLRGGTPLLLLERFGTRVWTLAPWDRREAEEGIRQLNGLLHLPEQVRPFRGVSVELVDGERAAQSPLEPVLRSLGYRRERNQSMRFDGFP
jgi:ATP-dependent Lhr-like helicase